MRISDWSSDVCSSDLRRRKHILPVCELQGGARELKHVQPRIDRGRTADPAVQPDAQPEQLAQYDRARGWHISLQQLQPGKGDRSNEAQDGSRRYSDRGSEQMTVHHVAFEKDRKRNEKGRV